MSLDNEFGPSVAQALRLVGQSNESACSQELAERGEMTPLREQLAGYRRVMAAVNEQLASYRNLIVKLSRERLEAQSALHELAAAVIEYEQALVDFPVPGNLDNVLTTRREAVAKARAAIEHEPTGKKPIWEVPGVADTVERHLVENRQVWEDD